MRQCRSYNMFTKLNTARRPESVFYFGTLFHCARLQPLGLLRGQFDQ
jgi:hypothetical protein